MKKIGNPGYAFKPENVLITEKLNCRIIDFGLSRCIERMSVSKTAAIGTSYYMSPEVTKGEDYNFKCDVFGYGIMAWEIMTGTFSPFGKSTSYRIEFKIASEPTCRPDPEKLKFKSEELNFLQELLPACWDHDAKCRPTFENVLEAIEGKKMCKIAVVVDDEPEPTDEKGDTHTPESKKEEEE